MPRAKKNYTEIDDIRDDLDSLKTNVVELTRHLKHDSTQQIDTTREALMDRLMGYRDASKKRMKDMEKQVKAKPTQSIMMAFAAGAIASFMLRGRN